MQRLQENPEKALKELSVDKIVELLVAARDAYYNSDKPLISDEIYDIAVEYVQAHYPKNSFLKEVGAPVHGQKVELPYWMGSLNKIRDDEKSIGKWVRDYPGDVVVSDKLDGNSGMLVIDAKTKTSTLYSRGDGHQGHNISRMIPFLRLPTLIPPQTIAVRGELIISRGSWERIKDVGANARNVVAGCLNKKVPDPVLAEHVDFVAYELVHPKMTPAEGLAFLREKGFNVVHHTVIKESVNMSVLSDILMNRRQASPYEVDGIVVCQDKVHRLVKDKNPAYAFAYKSIHTHEEVEVTVTEVEWNVSKDGYMKPTVKFRPVLLAGVTISRATGFNAGFIEKNVVGPGARILIIRSGDVIPHITKVLAPSATQVPSFPLTTKYHWNATHVDIMIGAPSKEGEGARNGAHAEEDHEAMNADMMKRTLEHFMKKLDIRGVGPGIVSKIVDAGFNTIPKVFRITKADLFKIDGFKDKSATNVVDAIHLARDNAQCEDIMVATNVFGRGMGHRKIQSVVKAFPDILDRTVPAGGAAAIAEVDGIGPATAQLFIDKLPKFFKLLDEMGVPCRKKPVLQTDKESKEPKEPKEPKESKEKEKEKANAKAKASLANMTIVFTGFRNKEWEQRIESAAGKVSSSVSKNTSLVVASDPNDDSGKIKKARDLGVRIVSVEVFRSEYI